jgi:hypothetical protein
MGGDEFTILLTRIERAAPAVEVAERICEMLGEPIRLGQDVRTRCRSRRASASRSPPPTTPTRATCSAVPTARCITRKSQGKGGRAMDPGSLEPAGNGSEK